MSILRPARERYSELALDLADGGPSKAIRREHALLAVAMGLLTFASACSRKEPQRATEARPSSSVRVESTATESAEVEASRKPLPVVPGLLTTQGKELALRARAAKTKGVVVNAWATWCGSCKGEMPMLLGLAAALKRDGIELAFVSVDEPENRLAARAFLEERGAPLPSYWADRPLGVFKEALNPRWPGMLPATFLYDADGRLRYFWGGPVLEEELLGVVRGFLAGDAIDGESITGVAPGRVEP